MPSTDPFASPLQPLADTVGARLQRLGIKLTLGGEPTLVPDQPDGAEWNVAAVGPTKLGYAYRLAGELISRYLPGAVTIYTPGKRYPGEVNPRWVVNVLANRDGTPIIPPRAPGARAIPPARLLEIVRAGVTKTLKLPAANWASAHDPTARSRHVAVLPLDHNGKRWVSERWPLPKGRKTLLLVGAEGPAGLRLPLADLPPAAMRRALTLEASEDGLHLFIPPLLQVPCRQLLDLLTKLLAQSTAPSFFEGYLPLDDANCWTRVGLTADPGVLEINLPPCETWHDYHRWLVILEETGAVCGLRSWKDFQPGDPGGTGGGNHLLFGGPTLEENPFFARPAWVASLLRYFQAHPCLAYFFTGRYVGASSQAPRPDESARDLYDLDLAYRYFEGLPAGDHRYLLGETLRHLHTDISGNTHRSEISFDKFWDVNGPPSAAAGLIEFRAIESMPHAAWMSLVALLWQAVAVYTVEHPAPGALVAHGSRLHDEFFLPTPLWADLNRVLADLRAGGFDFAEDGFLAIWQWRFPLLLQTDALEVRRACEGWPLLSETPSEGGSTSRFVDTSIERLEFAAPPAWARRHRLFVNGREIRLTRLPTAPGKDRARVGCGLRYRRTALFPSLHPGILPHLPLEVVVTDADGKHTISAHRLAGDDRQFQPLKVREITHKRDRKRPAIKSSPALLTYDLRLG